MDFIPQHEFRKCVARYQGNKRVRSFTCQDQFLSMAFAQLTYRESLRDIEACLRAMHPKLYHMGFRGRIARSTLAEANDNRDWRIYGDFTQVLISRARQLYADEKLTADVTEAAYALDSTTIDLCLALFPWAKFRQNKAAVKMHTLLDLRGSIPTFIAVTPGTVHDVRVLDYLPIEPGAIYVMDRGYLDFARLYRIHQGRAYFVIRAKDNLKFDRHRSGPADKSLGLLLDQTGKLSGDNSLSRYPDKIRRVRYYDAANDQELVLLTNHFELPGLAVADLYRLRWQVELFFKWIKQHLRIKAFYGTSENAVKTQIWTAISVYTLVAIMRKELKIPCQMHTILQVLSLSLFEKIPILQAITGHEYTMQGQDTCEQLILLDF
jgi:transposase